MIMFTQMGDTIFGIEKWKFQGSVTGTFANRILNGETAFGILVDGPVTITGAGTFSRIFYTRR